MAVEEIRQIKDYREEWTAEECIDRYGLRLIINRSEALKEEQKMAELVKNTTRKRVLGEVEYSTGDDMARSI